MPGRKIANSPLTEKLQLPARGLFLSRQILCHRRKKSLSFEGFDKREESCYYLDNYRIDVCLNNKKGGVLLLKATFRALSDSTRREILSILREGPKTAGEIAAHFPTTFATISHHLAVLRDCGLISDEKQGKYILYELNTSVLEEIAVWLSSFKKDSPPLENH